MPSFELKPASSYPLLEIADLLTRGFEGYLVPIQIDEAALLPMLRRDSIDLSASRVLLKEGKPIGVALIARRGWTSRLAAMGIVSNSRCGGAWSGYCRRRCRGYANQVSSPEMRRE